jgi:4-amino-4-deoxy-L-arabinose transferase-like glycosyltransferase
MVGLAARLPGLATKPLWYDEAFAVLFARAGIPAMLTGTLAATGGSAADIHPLLYYIVLRGWSLLLGDTGAAVRALSVIAGLLGLAVVYLLARRLFDRRLALVCGVLAALSPFQVHYSQEVRMYSLLAFLLMAATYALRAAMDRSGWGAWLAFSLFSVAAQYTHNLAAFYLIPLALTPVWMRAWKHAWRTLLAGALAVALYLPWLARLPSQVARIDQAYWVERPGGAELVRTLLVFASSLPLSSRVLPLALACSILVLVLGLVALVRALNRRADGASHALWLAYLAGAPAALLFVVSQRLPVYLDRALLPSACAFGLWIGWALWSGHLSRPMAWTGRAALAVAMITGLVAYYGYRGFPYAPFAKVGSYLESVVGPEEVIVHSNKLSALPGMYYTPRLRQEFIADPPGASTDTLAAATQAALGIAESATAPEAAGEAGGVWLIMFAREPQDYLEAGGGLPPAFAWLEANFERQDERDFGELRLIHYRRAGAGQEG